MCKKKWNADLRSLRIKLDGTLGSGKMPDLRVCTGYGIRSMPTTSNLS